jgi:hypothetical protein
MLIYALKMVKSSKSEIILEINVLCYVIIEIRSPKELIYGKEEEGI